MTSINVRRLAATVARARERIVGEARKLSGGGHMDPDTLLTMRLPWYQVRADTDGRAINQEDPASIFIFDEIGGSLGVQASELVQDIESITAPEIRVRINSPGGSVFDAVAIYNALNHHPARIITYVDALAASAASIIAMAGDEIVMMPGSQMMIHDASAQEGGNAEDHRKLGTFLDRQSDNLADIYRMRAGGTVEDWRVLMLEETWAFAGEAVVLGLADRVEQPPVRSEPAGMDKHAFRPSDDDPAICAECGMAKGDPMHDMGADGAPSDMARSFDLSHFRYAGRRAAPEPGAGAADRRQQLRKKAERVTVRDRDPEPEFARSDMVPATTGGPDRAQAALARRAAAPTRVQGPVARNVSTFALGTSERRGLPFPAQMRAESVQRDGKTFFRVEGYASVYDTPYSMWDEFGPYDEVVVTGAGDATLASKPHVVFLANHGGLALASTRNGTLELANDGTGLRDVAWLNPERQDAKDLVLAIEDQTVEEQSFAFYINEGLWNADMTQFRIMSFDIDRGDVSAVNYGANPHTSIAARQREIFAELRRMGPAQARAAARVLGGREDIPVTPEVVGEMIRTEVAARMDKPEKVGTSLVHRWAQLMSDDPE